MGAIVNIKKLTKNQEISFGETVELILSRKPYNTKIAYENAYREFFFYLFNKKFVNCCWDEIKSID